MYLSTSQELSRQYREEIMYAVAIARQAPAAFAPQALRHTS